MYNFKVKRSNVLKSRNRRKRSTTLRNRSGKRSNVLKSRDRTKRSTTLRNRSGKRSTKTKSRRKNDGTGNIGRFKINSVTNVNEDVRKKLYRIEDDAKLSYKVNVDFMRKKEFSDILKSKDINFIKFNLDRYIDTVKNAVLYPQNKINKFRKKYLKKLLDIKEELDKVVLLRSKYPRKIIKKVDILPSVYEYEEYDELLPISGLTRQSSYQDEPYEGSGMLKKYKHKTDPRKERHYYGDDRYFEVEDTHM
jgi:hypothetical protein